MNQSFRIPGLHWFWYALASCIALIAAPLLLGQGVAEGRSVMPGVGPMFGGPALVLLITSLFLYGDIWRDRKTTKRVWFFFVAWACLLLSTVLCAELYSFYTNVTRVQGSFFLISPGGFVGALIIALGTYGTLRLSFFLMSKAEEFSQRKKRNREHKTMHRTPLFIALAAVLLIAGSSVLFTGDPVFVFILLLAPFMQFFSVTLIFPVALVFLACLFFVFVFFAYLNWLFLRDSDSTIYSLFKQRANKMLFYALLFWFVHFITLTLVFPLRTSSPFFFM